ncbi:hypothetical protein [Bacillus massilinigeriensis]|uniref:hypothetical protein n=1 Tax=Bacillus massilionigeriensis TaxID=1805475 RepID=UPI0009FC298D|nr:hypothetical protein [Bacillus massilionigeriensis]
MSNKVKQELEKIEIPNELHERVKLGVMKAKSEKPKRKFKRLMIPLVASAFVVFSAGVAAASIPSFNNLVAIVSPEIALMLQPIETSTESDGIKMEVVAAMNDNEMAVIYVTMQDLTGNRIDETLDIYDYSLTEGHMFNSQIVNFDENTNTATLRIQANGGEYFEGKKLNFHIDSFLSNKQTFEDVEVDINLLDKKYHTPQTVTLDSKNISGVGGKLIKELNEKRKLTVLKPDKTEITLPEIKFMHISNIGIIDSRLHIQTKWNKDNIDDHGYFYLVDPSGNEIQSSSIYFEIDDSDQTKNEQRIVEYVFDIDNVDLNKQKLTGDFVTNGSYTTGNWNTTFKIESISEEKKLDFNKDFGSWVANSVTVSPLGVTLYGNGEFNNSDKIVASVTMKDGSVQILDSLMSFSEKEKVTVKFLSSLPLDISNIETVNINGIEIELN